jgi:hypothetical protein
MPNEELVAENVVEPETDIDESPASEEQDQEEVVEAPEAEPTEEDSTSPQEPTSRAERRIRDLVERQKAISAENDALKGQFYQQGGTPGEFNSIVRPGESEIDPLELQKRIDAYVDGKVNQTLSRRSSMEQQNKLYEEHVTDVERVLEKYPEFDETSEKFDPVMGKKFVELFNKLNDAQADGSGYRPKVKATEVAQLLTEIRDQSAMKRVADISVKKNEQRDAAAVQPNATSDSSDDSGTKLTQAFSKAKQTGNDKDWAAYYRLLRSQ